MNTPVELILSKLPDARRNGSGWSARCPAHDDRRASLSIGVGDDGRALVNCHAGCSPEAIVAAVGLTMRDLMPIEAVDVDTNRLRPRKTAIVSTASRQNGKIYPTANAAVGNLERQHGKRSAWWTYHNAEGQPVGVIVRWDQPNGKDIRPVRRNGNGSIIGGMPEPRPLYGLPELADAKRVYVCEGEKAADAARSIDLVATTSPHGSNSAGKADWTPLAGRECVLLPDNDNPGRKYADEVADILSRLTPASVVKIVELPNLPPGGDIVDWIDAHGDAAEPDELRRQVEALADEAKSIEHKRSRPRIESFRPFPVDALPEPVRGFVVAGARAIGCDSSFVALPILSALASAIGNTRRIQLKRGWSEPAILWTAIVGDSGTMKSPALELALRPVRERQRRSLAEHAERMNAYSDELLRYERDLDEWKRSKAGGDPPMKPEEPIADRLWCDDATVEALAVLLLNQWRGLLMVRDELSGWIGGFDRYAKGHGGDVARWLEMFGGRSMLVDRKTGKPRTLYVPRAAASVTGGIQPETLRRCLGQEYRDNGLAARLLLAWPPRWPKRWTEADIAPEVEAEIARLFDRLYDLKPASGDDGDPEPVIVELTPEGKRAWIDFYNVHAEEHTELTGDLSAAWSKLEGYAARLALVVHFVRWATGDPTLRGPDAVDAASIAAAVELARWFGNEARRVYWMLEESDEVRDRRRLAELIQRRGGSATPRDLMRSSRRFATATDAEVALDELARAGFGTWQEDDHGGGRGRPVRRFSLADTVDVDRNSAKPEENRICVNVNAVNGVENAERVKNLLAETAAEDSDEWGEI